MGKGGEGKRVRHCICIDRGKRQFSTVLTRDDKCKWFPLADCVCVFNCVCVCVCVVNFMSQQVECAVKATRGVGMHEGEEQQHNATTPTPPADTQLEVFLLTFFSCFFAPLGKHEIALSFECVCEGICVCACTLRVRVRAWQCAKK